MTAGPAENDRAPGWTEMQDGEKSSLKEPVNVSRKVQSILVKVKSDADLSALDTLIEYRTCCPLRRACLGI